MWSAIFPGFAALALLSVGCSSGDGAQGGGSPTPPRVESTEAMKPADLIWNRACQFEQPERLRAGDLALRAMIRFDGLAMNGGAHHALEACDETEIEAVIAGHRRFGLGELADLMAEWRLRAPYSGWTDEQIEAADDRYYELADGPLQQAAYERFETQPEDFAPLPDRPGR